MFIEVHEDTRMSLHILQKVVTGKVGYEGLTQNYICSTIHIQSGLLHLQYKNSKVNGKFQISSNTHGKVLWLHPTQHFFTSCPPQNMRQYHLFHHQFPKHEGREKKKTQQQQQQQQHMKSESSTGRDLSIIC